MSKKINLVEGCIVEAIADCGRWDPALLDVKAGMTFQYRGKNGPGNHEFGPDYDRYGRDREEGLIGFDIHEEDLKEKTFTKFLRVLPGKGAAGQGHGRATV